MDFRLLQNWKTSKSIVFICAFVGHLSIGSAQTHAEPSSAEDFDRQYDAPDITVLERQASTSPTPKPLVEDVTAHTLASGQVQLGTVVEYGVSDRFMLGADMVAAMFGVPSMRGKYKIWTSGPHQVALNLGLAYVDRTSILWGSVREQFDELRARRAKIGLSWTNSLSSRLHIHTLWNQGFGSIELSLSEMGKKALFEAKYPGQSYGNEDDKSSESENQANASARANESFAQRTLLVSSVTGLMSDTFQISGEIRQQNGHKILVTSRVERVNLESLMANSMRLTGAHHWVWANFQFRFGVGAQYAVITGRDLDGEYIDETGVLPVSDIAFYWQL